jgi:hypothetical protein
MKTKLLAAAAMLLAMSSAQAANRTTTDYAMSGSWYAFSGTSTANRPLCGIASRDVSGGRFVAVKWEPGAEPFLQFSKTGWKIPIAAELQLVVKFDDDEPLEIPAQPIKLPAGLSTTHSTSLQSYFAEQEDTLAFLHLFSAARKFHISFPGSESPWIIDLTGSRDMANALTNCMNRSDKSAGSKTQPHAGSNTQHSGGKKPEQRRLGNNDI